MKFKLITLFIILCLGFTSCSENETPEPRTTRTILVYMMANNSLNSFASKNIESMIEGATSKNLNGGNLIVYYAPAGSPPELLRIKEEKSYYAAIGNALPIKSYCGLTIFVPQESLPKMLEWYKQRVGWYKAVYE